MTRKLKRRNASSRSTPRVRRRKTWNSQLVKRTTKSHLQLPWWVCLQWHWNSHSQLCIFGRAFMMWWQSIKEIKPENKQKNLRRRFGTFMAYFIYKYTYNFLPKFYWLQLIRIYIYMYIYMLRWSNWLATSYSYISLLFVNKANWWWRKSNLKFKLPVWTVQ